ncbi:ImmA/IrrE family metallo-endopeptidase [Peribacillus asahii]|uniref:ImmA/IrrE family metallo-endopeptidase n=1 Tax=Peribacillus asahii TaxID=228899 RepID=UPI0038289E58
MSEKSLICIGVNKNHSRQRQRFTIAHELAIFSFTRELLSMLTVTSGSILEMELHLKLQI